MGMCLPCELIMNQSSIAVYGKSRAATLVLSAIGEGRSNQTQALIRIPQAQPTPSRAFSALLGFCHGRRGLAESVVSLDPSRSKEAGPVATGAVATGAVVSRVFCGGEAWYCQSRGAMRGERNGEEEKEERSLGVG